MKTRFLSGFLVVVGGGAAIVGCFQPNRKVVAETSSVVAPSSPAPANSLSQQPVSNPSTVTPVATLPTNLSPGVTEIGKLFQSNVSEDVLLAFIKSYEQPFYPTADEILYLNDLGVSDNVVTTLINHKGDPTKTVAAEPKQQAQAVDPAPAPAPAPVAVTAPLVPQEPAPALVATAPETQVTINHFYDTLSPYGTWVETEYGRCWRPAAVVYNPTWRPYCDRGHWIYTDAGWYWASDYSWGWATFHYGRWCSDARFGWVWVPDVTWGPSWVSWRYNSDYCGWAPLPPLARYGVGVGFTYRSANVGISFEFGLTDSCYTFVPVNRFCDPHPYRYCAPRTSSHTIYNRTTVINNYTTINNNKTIINEGIGRQRIEVATKQPIQKVAIHEWPKNSVSETAPDRIHKVGKDLVVYKPHAPEAVAPKFAPARTTGPGNNPESVYSGRNHNDKNSSPAAQWNGKSGSPTAGTSTVSLPNTGNPGHGNNNADHGKPARVAPATDPRSPQVVRQPQRNQIEAPQTTPEISSPRVPGRPQNRDTVNAGQEKPRHNVSPSAVGNNTPTLPTPQNRGPQVIATTPQLPLPQTSAPATQNPGRGHNANRDADSPGRGHQQERVESPRLSPPVAPRYSAPAQNTAETPAPATVAPSYRQPQPMTPNLPRATPQQAVVPRGHGNEGARVSPGQERSGGGRGAEKLAEKDSSNPGNGNGNGRNRF